MTMTTIQLTIIRIEGYGPWTLTLGSDREAQLQMLQARIYHDVQRLFDGKNCIVYFNRFDEYFAVKMSMAIGAGATAFAASMSAYNARKEEKFADKDARIFGAGAPSADLAQIMHIDVDSSTKLSGRVSPYEITALVIKIYSRLADEFLKRDSLTFFLGGDNFMVVSNGVTKEQADEAIKKAIAGIEIKLNCGIGIGKTGKKAAEAATKALDTIRDLRDQGKIQTIFEIRC
jgi:GTP cyclohydrolase IIa